MFGPDYDEDDNEYDYDNCEYHDYFDYYDEDDIYKSDEECLIDGVGFADPGGNSALRAATASNPRDRPCPTCHRENILTRIDEMRGYQCNMCADAAES